MTFLPRSSKGSSSTSIWLSPQYPVIIHISSAVTYLKQPEIFSLLILLLAVTPTLSSAFLKPLSPIKLMLFIRVTSIIPTINIYLVTELKRFLYFLMKLYYSKLCLSMVFAIFYL